MTQIHFSSFYILNHNYLPKYQNKKKQSWNIACVVRSHPILGAMETQLWFHFTFWFINNEPNKKNYKMLSDLEIYAKNGPNMSHLPRFWANEPFFQKSSCVTFFKLCSSTFMQKIKNICWVVPSSYDPSAKWQLSSSFSF